MKPTTLQGEQLMQGRRERAGGIRRRIIRQLIALMACGISLTPCYADLAQINLEIKATIVSATCTVSAESKNKTIDMGTWAVKQFTATAGPGPAVPFTINLENCGAAASGVAVTFQGTADSQDNTLLALNGSSTATHLGLALLDHNRQRIPLGQAAPVYALAVGERNAALEFYAQYYATGGNVTAGSANADATFFVEYQ